MSDNGIIQTGVPIRFEWRNFRRQYRERNIGSLYLIQIEIDADTWATLETMPREADGEMVMWVTEVGGVKEEKPKKEKEPKGPHGQLWKHLHQAGFVNAPGVKETVEEARITETEPAWEILHRVFGVGGASLAVIGPEEIYAKFPPNEYPAVRTMVEQALRKAEKQ